MVSIVNVYVELKPEMDMAILTLDYEAVWAGMCRWCVRAGRAAARPVLLMWYVMRSKDTPRRDKLAIFCSLAYLVLPIDILNARRLPVIGWLDEVVALAVLVRKMSQSITPEMEARADRQLDLWFATASPALMLTEQTARV